MVPDSDEEWLLQVATGVAEPEIPGGAPQGEAMDVPPLQEFRAEPPVIDLEGSEVDAGQTNVVQMEEAEVPVAPESGVRQKGIVIADVPPTGKGTKRKDDKGAEGARAKGKKHKSGSHKSGSSSRYRSFALDEQFVKKSYEEYLADPLAAAVHTVLHVSDLVKEEKSRNELQVKELRAEIDAEKAAKEAAMTELGRVQNRLKLTVLTLVVLRGNIKALEGMREDLSKERAELKERLARSDLRQKELKEKEKLQSSEVRRLASRVSELEEKFKASSAAVGSGDVSQVAELQRQLKERDALLARSEEKAKKTAQLALKMRDKYFNLALDQIKVVNPGMESFKPVLHSSHVVEDGKIVKVDPVTKAKSIVFPPPASA